MLNKRINSIISILYEKIDSYVKTSFLAESLNVTPRTIQNDLKEIKKRYSNYSKIFSIESKTPFGTKLKIHDHNRFINFLSFINENNNDSLNNKVNRINKLLHFLMNQSSPVSLSKCADSVFVSKSTIILDLKNLENILNKYSLKLNQTKGTICVIGLERDKRMCLIDNDNTYFEIIPSDSIMNSEIENLRYLRKLFVDKLLEEQYQISDVEFQNLIIWLNVSIKRMQKFFFLSKEDVLYDKNSEKEYSISNYICNKLEKKYGLQIPDSEKEFLAMFLYNRGSFIDANYISQDLTNFIAEALTSIKDVFPTSFIDDVSLRMSLALHCAPLITRARNNIQMKNKMVRYVKQNFQYAFDIATYFSFLLSKKYNCKISEEETSFIAIYFNRSLIENNKSVNKKRICVITASKKSLYFLLEQYLYDNFQKSISSITFLTPEEVKKTDLNQFDTFFSTDNGEAVNSGLATKINCFPSESDMEIIKGKIEGYNNFSDILKFFDKRLFFVGNYSTKDQIQNTIVTKASDIYNLNNLEKEIKLREEFGSTYFGNGVAILHPMHSPSLNSFIGEVILENGITWDSEGNKVNIVFLVCLQKDNLEAFKVWDYISPIIFDSSFKKKLNSANDFEKFCTILSDFIKNKK